mmetsp:Transcript_41966/g.30797  ORF Transcript_41966/g.30797 Transcript_41966/m.30797 type:complete len:95 (+) Transcript_41966:130-414(+)
MGRSRSATCVIMYIMKRFGLSFEEALELVKMRREVVDPNEGFLAQLKEFEENNFDFMIGNTVAPVNNEVACLVDRRHSLANWSGKVMTPQHSSF